MAPERSSDRGVAAVEFALVLPLLLLMLFLVIEFSIALYDKAVITNASREGARSGIVMRSPRYTTGDIAATVSTYCAANLISFGPAAPSILVPAACASSGDLLTVNVTYTYAFLVLPNFLGGGTGLTLTGNTVMRCE